MILLIVHEMRFSDPILQLRVLKIRQFSIALSLVVVLSFVLFGTGLLNPIFLQEFMGYTAWRAGLIMAPRAMAAMTSMMIAGQVAHDTAGNLVGENDFAAQVEQVFKNLDAAVRAAGGTFHDIVKINNYCVASIDPAQFAAFRTVRDRYVNTGAPPVSTFVFVSRLVRPGWLFEIDAMAVIGA